MTGKLVKTLGYNIHEMDISSDGNLLASFTLDSTILIIDINTGLIHKKLTNHLDCVTSVSFSLDNKHLLSSSDDNTARIWDVKTGNEIIRFSGHTRNVVSAKYSNDGQLVVFVSKDKIIKIWNSSTGEEIRQFSDSNSIFLTSLSFDNKYLIIVSSKEISIWNISTGNLYKKYPFDNYRLFSTAISSDGKFLVTSTSSNGIAKIWDLESGNIINEFTWLDRINDYLYHLVFSPNGKFIFTNTYNNAEIFDASTGNSVKVFNNINSSNFVFASFSEDNNSILISNDLGCYLFPIDDIAPAFQRQINNKDNPFLIINGRNIGFKNIPVSFSSQKEPILTLFNLNGKSIARINQKLFNRKSNPCYPIVFQLPYNLAPGTYLYNLSSGNKSIKGRMSLTR